MEREIALTRSQIVEVFRRWEADVAANPDNFTDERNPEDSADHFILVADSL